ncbi:signal peptidase I [Micromonospora sp. NPDC000668]|uniref:signal peptidase I n=1 Tax=Micromonospora sp. NPDC000668 TaxID=3364219 RepID=UPI0036B36331
MRKIAVLMGLVLSLTACASLGDGARDKRYEVNSPTMEPTIRKGSTVGVDVVKPGDYQPRTGDVVMFNPPDSYGWNPDGRPRILRVAAVPGDTIACCDAQGWLIRNGTAQHEPYIQIDGAPTQFQPITVPPGEIYLLGDYRGVANDSSQNGSVPAENVIGVVKP